VKQTCAAQMLKNLHTISQLYSFYSFRDFSVHTDALWGLCPVFWHNSVFQKYSKLQKVDVIELRSDQNMMLHNGNVNLTGHC